MAALAAKGMDLQRVGALRVRLARPEYRKRCGLPRVEAANGRTVIDYVLEDARAIPPEHPPAQAAGKK